MYNRDRSDREWQRSANEPRARILLVDDLPQNLEILCGLLEPEGYALELAQDGQEALEMALKSPPDLILMDVSMPRMSGLEACRALKADERTRLVPIVLITALSAREDRIQGIAAGCDDFLAKPVDFEELLAPHAGACSGRRSWWTSSRRRRTCS